MNTRALTTILLLALHGIAMSAGGPTEHGPAMSETSTAEQAGDSPNTLGDAPSAADTPGDAGDADFATYTDTEIPEAPSGTALIARLLGSLVIVIGLIVVTAVVFKRLLGRSKLAPGGGLIEVVQTMPLGGKRRIYLVKVAGRVLVVGAAGDNLSTLTELPEADIVAEAETVQDALSEPDETADEETPPRPKTASKFAGVLKTLGRQFATGRVS